jgi:hypothetical protein
MWYSNLERKTFISRHILHQHRYNCPIALTVRRNPQHRSLLTVLSHFRTWSGIICDFRTSFREFLDPVVNSFTRQTFPTVNRKHFFMNILLIESFFHKKEAQRNVFLRQYTPREWSPICTLKPASEHAHARLLPTLPQRFMWATTSR